MFLTTCLTRAGIAKNNIAAAIKPKGKNGEWECVTSCLRMCFCMGLFWWFWHDVSDEAAHDWK